MKSAEVIMVLRLFLIIKTVTGQPLSNCGCYLSADPTDATGCSTRGCSVGINVYCDSSFDTNPYRYATLADTPHSATDYASYRGCNCPNSTSTASHNGYYGTSANRYGYDYSTCTDYGGNARDANGKIPIDVNAATDCCNFCCNRNDPYPSSLPPECYNPDGTSCDWYKDCLEKKYPCQGDPDDYAIKYATHYCEEYNENYINFTELGRQWVDAVRKCLQLKLVPLLNESSATLTCKQIKNKAFVYHAPCYVEPYPGGPSFCSLGKNNWLQVFRTIYPALFTDLLASLHGTGGIFMGCGEKVYKSATMRLVRMLVSVKKGALTSLIAIRTAILNELKSKIEQGIATVEELASEIVEAIAGMDDIASRIVEEIAESELWDPRRISRFVYFPTTWDVRATTQEQQITIDILIADAFGSDNSSAVEDVQNYLDQIINHLVQSTEQGKLDIETTNGTFYVQRMDQCLDTNCNTTDGNPAIAPPYNFAMHSVNINIFIIMGLIFALLFKK